jgi:uncharacterized protein (TIGR02246 family)
MMRRTERHGSRLQDERAVRSLFRELLDRWNERDADAFAGLFAAGGNVVGFDGSQLKGSDEIAASLRQIFGDHQTAAYVAKVREVRVLTRDVAVLSAVAGMVPPGQSDIDPAVNAVQTLVAVKEEGRWRIALFQNTPAQFHGRPALARDLTEELRQLLNTS